MMVRVKICGITNGEDATQAANLGADAVGFIFYPPSPRFVEPDRVGEIVASLPPFVTPVGVFVNEARARVQSIVESTGLRAIQLHGDETPTDCEGYEVPVIRALRVGKGFGAEVMDEYPVDTFLLDTAKHGLYGGTGETFDWAFADEAKKHGRVILSGGIGPDNVGAAIRAVKPYAVDCGSGVEAEPGKKDPEKLVDFFDQVRSA